jgi:feruloyl esterase
MGWNTSGGPQPFDTPLEHFKYVVFKDANWDYKTLNLERDVASVDKDREVIDAIDPNLRPFFSRGGKLIQYHGWADPRVSPGSSVSYYDSVVKTIGSVDKVKENYRLFMVPGMGHCNGGDGPASFDMIGALEQWVEKGKAPDFLPAAHLSNGQPDRTRILCPYPQVATYKGSGDTNDAANFMCK